MMVFLLAVVALLAPNAGAASPAGFQLPGVESRNGGCSEWHECRERALAAADRGEYEAFHDLAWRAIQTGPPKDPGLMYLLARAQALSGRPYDALIMLGRLADMGVASDAPTNEDFRRTRQLPGWPGVAARIERLNQPGSLPSAVQPAQPAASAPAATPVRPATAARSAGPAPVPPAGGGGAVVPQTGSIAPAAPALSASPDPATTPAPPAPVVPPVPLAAPVAPVATPPVFPAASPALVAEAARFSTGLFAPAGLAYDAVSRRLLFGDRLGRKLIVVADGARSPVDLVRSDSAGFDDISAIEIDARRGDLWVASTAGGAGLLHKLQLVSGRPLKTFRPDGALLPVNFVDLTLSPAGAVLILDALSRQVLVLPSGGRALERGTRIEVAEPTSLAAGNAEGIAYVAHRDGISRIDLRAQTATVVDMPKGVALGRLERLRWYRNALIAVSAGVGDARRIIRLELNAAGTGVTRAMTLEPAVPIAGNTFVTISGQDLVYLAEASGNVAVGSSATTRGPAEFVAYRMRLP